MVADSAGRGILAVQGVRVSYGSQQCRKGCLTCAGVPYGSRQCQEGVSYLCRVRGFPMVADSAGRGVLPVQGAGVSYGSRQCRKGCLTCAGCGGFLR